MVKNKKKLTYIVAVFIVCMIGASYALWIATSSQTGENKLASSCFSLAITNEVNEIHLQNQFPITDEEGRKLEPFQFTIQNTCTLFANYTVSLELLNGTTLNSNYVKVQFDREAPIKLNEIELGKTTLSNSVESRILARGSLDGNDSEDYSLRLWLDENITTADTEVMNKTLAAKIVISGQPSTYSPVKQGITKLSDAMLANEYQTTVEQAKTKIAAKGTPDFSQIAPLVYYEDIQTNEEESITADKPHPSLNGSHGLSGTSGTKNENQQIILGTSYTFNQDNGTYTLENRITVDPTTITDYLTKDYYYCNTTTSIDATGNVTTTNKYNGCTNIYRINHISEEETGTAGTNDYRLRYIIKGTKYKNLQKTDKSDKGLYQAEDDLGTSYYYRGSVNNNFVKFAGYYWRIIRRNGDGSIRLIYNGDKPDQTGSHTQIKGLAFNTLVNNPAYEGYMYGNVLNTSYDQTHANENSSTIKTFLEDWYKTNIYDTGYHDYVADEIFCNDRSVTSGDGYTMDVYSYFGTYKRLNQSKSPTLICPQDNDKFTTTNATVGNKSLTYPIGLITADELSIAGSVIGKFNKLFYLRASIAYWTMSPYFFSSGSGAATGLDFSFHGTSYAAQLTDVYGVRPVINLKVDVEITGGIGTANDPFVVKEK